MGIPLLNIMFAGQPQLLSTVSIPLLVHHAIQILVASLLCDRVKQWIFTIPTFSLSSSLWKR